MPTHGGASCQEGVVGWPGGLAVVAGLAGATFCWLPRNCPYSAPPRGYVAETSVDGKSWTPAGSGEFSNIAYALSTQRLPFTIVRPVRYLRLTFAEMSKPAEKLAIAGIGGFTKR